MMAAEAKVPAPVPVKKADVVVPLPAKLVAGGVAGVIGTTLIFPLDMVKTRLQNSGVGGGTVYKGPVDCFKRTLAAEGFKGLYNGLRPNLLGVFPEKALKLSVNDTVREFFTRRNADGKIKVHQEIIAGGTAGLIQVAVTNPMEIVKLRMQLAGENLKPGQPRLTAAQTVSELGFRGLYKGIAACWLRDIPFSFIFFPLYAHLNRTFNPRDDSIVGLFTAGAMAGSLAAGSVTPFDVVKTRLQVRGSPYTGILDCMKKTAANDGIVAFAKGWLPRMLVQAPLFGCTLLSYEVLKEFYRRQGQAAAVSKQK